MFKDPKDKNKPDKQPNKSHLGNHLTDFATDLLLGGNKEDINSSFTPGGWVNKPKDKNKKNK